MIPQNDEGGSKRLHIIGANEIAAIYDIPRFSAEDQAHFFSLSRVLCIFAQKYTLRGGETSSISLFHGCFVAHKNLYSPS